MIHTQSGTTRTLPGGTEYRWSCTCGVRSVWFPTKARRDQAQQLHRAAHARGNP